MAGIPNGLTPHDLANVLGNAKRRGEAMVKLACHRLLLAGQVTLREGRYVAVQPHGWTVRR